MLLFRSGRFARRSWFVWLLSIFLSILISVAQVFAQSKGQKRKQGRVTRTPAASPGEQSLTNIPLPIVHEAKALVLPTFETKVHLRRPYHAHRPHRLAPNPP